MFVRAVVLTMPSPCTMQRASLPNLTCLHGPSTALHAAGSPRQDNISNHVPMPTPSAFTPALAAPGGEPRDCIAKVLPRIKRDRSVLLAPFAQRGSGGRPAAGPVGF